MKRYSQYSGIVIGVVYGLIIRILGGIDYFGEIFNVFSITFLWVTPIIVGLIPILISSNKIYQSKAKLFVYPVLTVLIFLGVALITGLEDIVCLLIIGAPFILASGMLGLLLGLVMRQIKAHKNKLMSIVVIPFVFGPIENVFSDRFEKFEIESRLIIHQNHKEIFANIIEVPELKEDEYQSGFFQTIGIPRPLFSRLEMKNGKEYRVGYFSENFKLYESVDEVRENEFVNFKIHIDKSQLRNKPTDRHVLQGNYFKFENISYTLNPIDEFSTEIILHCDYSIESKMNGYANFWASRIISDFEKRLLYALKVKFEK